MNKRRILVLVIIFSIALGFIYYSKPTKVDLNLEGVILNKSKESNVENVNIRFQGYTYRKVLKPNNFRGYIYINDKKYPHVSVELTKDSYANMLYWSGDENSPVDGVFLSLGEVFIGENFNSIGLIFTTEDGARNDKILIAPARDVKEAEEVLEEIELKVGKE